MTTIVGRAGREIRALPCKRDAERIMPVRDVVALVALFDAQGHSGRTAASAKR
ncbi:hypothetical protein [Methylobacterium planeticum]|uniref:hypothetical protein n=1 Tax=Methylobacterium planeticum TaxID=2615211 RepID=UPI00177ED673|nr:hypothetical protein [Methylobacterium planeticum]